jgi:TIR domain
MGDPTGLKTCFISAPAGAPLGVLRASLEARGLRVLVPHDLAVGTDWSSEIQKQLSQADLVIGVLTSERQSPWVLFELGQASALGRRIVLITSPKADPIPFVLHRVLVLRIELDNQEAMGFALDQLLSAPDQPKRAAITKSTGAGLGPPRERRIGPEPAGSACTPILSPCGLHSIRKGASMRKNKRKLIKHLSGCAQRFRLRSVPSHDRR